MKRISQSELAKITGGEIAVWVYFAVSAAVVFIAGIIDGYAHPKSCN